MDPSYSLPSPSTKILFIVKILFIIHIVCGLGSETHLKEKSNNFSFSETPYLANRVLVLTEEGLKFKTFG